MSLATLSAEAGAAGLGRLEVQSALGQPLQAEVEITALGRDESGSLSARLASQEAFKQAGLEYGPVLSGLRFAIESRSGRSFIKITSVQPINEPFVDLLVELNWATGKFVREYTFLLDPADVRLGREAVAAATGAGAAAVEPPAASRAQPVAPAAQPATRRRSARQASAEPRAALAGEIQVKRGDTLGQIARTHQPEGVSLDQAMLAIYQANPEAFSGNLNRLRQGARLSIPAKEAMLGTDAAEATKTVQLHSSNFTEYRQRLSGAARVVEGPRAGQSAAGAVGAQVEDRAAAVGDQLRLSKPAGSGGAAAGAVGSSNARGASAEQQVASVAALNEARSRIGDLEKNVSDLQNLLELKNKALADAQAKLDELHAGATPPADSMGAASALKPESLEPPKALIPEQAEGMAGAEEALKPAPEMAAPEVAPEAPVAEAAKPEVAEPAAPVVAEPGLMDGGLGNPLLLTGLGLVGVLGAGYGVYAVRRRRRVERFEDSLMAADALGSNSLFGTTGGQSVDTSAGAFGAAADAAADAHSTEVDPIAEADVYIAYGRESQAEEILKEALKRQPERQAVRAKLLEIYSGRRDVKAFESLAREMHNMTGGRNEEWLRVVTQGLAIDPTNPLYAGVSHADRVAASDRGMAAEGGSATAFASAAAVAGQALQSRLAAEPVAPVEAPATEPSGLGFDPLTPPAPRSAPVASVAPAVAAASSLSERFDLPTLDFATPESESESEESVGLQLDLANLERLTQVGAARAQESDAVVVAEPALAGVEKAALGQSGRWQEMATKLDLAAAYQEIGDKEGARELLQEVIAGGDNGQQQRARTMLREIG